MKNPEEKNIKPKHTKPKNTPKTTVKEPQTIKHHKNNTKIPTG